MTDIETLSLDEMDRHERSTGASRPENKANGGARYDRPPILQVSNLEGRAIPPRLWAVQDRVPLHNVTLFSGEGAIGKSIVMAQLATATALNRDWLGAIPESGPVIVVNAEEDEDEFHRRLVPIVEYYAATFADLGQLFAMCLAGRDAVLAAPDHDGIIRPTDLFQRLHELAIKIKPKLITIDNAADVFAGKENDRAHVRQFVTILRGLAIDADAAVLLSSHPSLTGIASGTGLSGSTAWHNSVRARLVMTAAKMDEGGESANDLRTLEMQKSNYGPIAAKITLRWRNGLFLPVGSNGTDWLAKVAAEKCVDDLFMNLLIKFNGNGQNVSDKRGTTYAPAAFAEHEAAKGVKKDALGKAMQRLLDAGRVKIENFGPPSRQRSRLVVVNK